MKKLLVDLLADDFCALGNLTKWATKRCEYSLTVRRLLWLALRVCAIATGFPPSSNQVVPFVIKPLKASFLHLLQLVSWIDCFNLHYWLSTLRVGRVILFLLLKLLLLRLILVLIFVISFRLVGHFIVLHLFVFGHLVDANYRKK